MKTTNGDLDFDAYLNCRADEFARKIERHPNLRHELLSVCEPAVREMLQATDEVESYDASDVDLYTAQLVELVEERIGGAIVSARWLIAVQHEAFGVEGRREYRGTEIGARCAAALLARRAGHGWAPVVREVQS